MATINAINSNIPIEIAKGGTNTTSFTNTNGQLLYDGTRLTTVPLRSAGSVLTSHGGTNPPTFEKAGMILLQQQTAAGVTNITFNSTFITNTYTCYLITYTQVTSSNATTTLLMDWSVNNGGAYLNTGFLSGQQSHSSNSASWGNTPSTVQNLIANNIPINQPFSGFVYLFNLASSSNPVGLGKTYWANSALFEHAFFNSTTTGVNNIRFAISAGTLSAGIFSLYGFAN